MPEVREAEAANAKSPRKEKGLSGRVLILANGEAPSLRLLKRLAESHDLILATDGAAHYAIEKGVAPHIICGDFDSVHLGRVKAAFPTAEFLPTPNQDRADLEKALHIAQERGAKSVTITGAAGGRVDHLLANFALLLRYHLEFSLCIVDDFSEVRALSGGSGEPNEIVLQTAPGDTISLISPGGDARVSLLGVQWTLEDYLLPIGTMGVSNVAIEERVTVRVEGGTLFLCHLPKA